MDTYAVIFDIESGGRKSRQQIEAPRVILEQQFLSYAQQAKRSSIPTSVKMYRKVPIYDNFNNRWVEREYSILYENDAFIKQKQSYEKNK